MTLAAGLGVRRRAGQPGSRLAALLAAVGLALGTAVAVLPPANATALVAGLLLAAAAVVEPLVGLGLTIAIGWAEPLLAAAGLLPLPYSQVLFLLFVGSWLLRGVLRHEIRWPRLPLTIFFFVYLAACGLSIYSFQPVSPADAAKELWKWLQMYLIAGVVYETGAGRRGLLLSLLLSLGLVEAGIGIWQFQFRGHGPAGFKILGNHWRAYGTLEQPNPFGGLMGLVWPLAAALALWAGLAIVDRWRHARAGSSTGLPVFGRAVVFIAAGAVAAACLASLFISYSRGAWLGAGSAAAVMVVLWPRRLRWGILLAAGSAAAFYAVFVIGLLPASIAGRFADVGDFLQVYDVRGVHINDTNFAIVERLAHWQAAVNMADARPLTGIGFGNYEPAYQDYRLAAWRYGLGHAHNIYLNVLAETGVVGLLGYLFFWLGVAALTWRALRGAGLSRALAVGLMGCWAHLAVHQVLDNLYVGNIPLYLGALFGILCLIQPGSPWFTQNAATSRSQE